MKLSPHEVADLVIKAGFSKTTIVPGTTDSEAVVAVAVAFAESSADTESISRTTAPITSDPGSIGQRDHGIFQLSGRWQYPKIQAAGGRWRDPVTNVKIAYAIFTGAGRTFTSWSVFTKNANGVAPYEQYLPDARLAVQQPWPFVDEVQLSISGVSAKVDAVSTKTDSVSTKVDGVKTDVAAVKKELDTVAANLVALSTALSQLSTVVAEMRVHFK
jgi:lysozyme-like protein